jgi:hypothetical protein
MKFVKKLRDKLGNHEIGFKELAKQFLATPVTEQADSEFIYEESAYIKRLEKGFGPSATKKAKNKLYDNKKVEVETKQKAQKKQTKKRTDIERE